MGCFRGPRQLLSIAHLFRQEPFHKTQQNCSDVVLSGLHMYTGGRTSEEEKAFDKYHQCWEPINTQPTDGDLSPEREVSKPRSHSQRASFCPWLWACPGVMRGVAHVICGSSWWHNRCSSLSPRTRSTLTLPGSEWKPRTVLPAVLWPLKGELHLYLVFRARSLMYSDHIWST